MTTRRLDEVVKLVQPCMFTARQLRILATEIAERESAKIAHLKVETERDGVVLIQDEDWRNAVELLRQAADDLDADEARRNDEGDWGGFYGCREDFYPDGPGSYCIGNLTPGGVGEDDERVDRVASVLAYWGYGIAQGGG